MIQRVLITALLALILTACSTPDPIVINRYVGVPSVYRTNPALKPPIAPEVFLGLDLMGQRSALVDYNIYLLQALEERDKRTRSLNQWDAQQRKIWESSP